jgi:hypothetical protein
MTLHKRLSVALFACGGLLSQTLPALAVRVTYNIDFFSVPTDPFFPSSVQKVAGENEFRYVSNGELVEQTQVGSGFFGYDTDNQLPPYRPEGTSFVVDEFSINLRGKSFTLNDLSQPRSIGNTIGPLENGNDMFFQFANSASNQSTQNIPNLLLIQSLPEYGTGCIFPATRCIVEDPTAVYSYPGQAPPIYSPTLYPPSQYTEVYPPFGIWRWFDVGFPGTSAPTDQGFFFTSLKEPKQVPEPPAEIIEIIGSLLLFFGTLRASWLKKARTQ